MMHEIRRMDNALGKGAMWDNDYLTFGPSETLAGIRKRLNG
jgi:hypothetical protein